MSAPDLCALAERVLGLRCAKHKRGERYTLRTIPSHGAGRILHSGLTVAELRGRICDRAATSVMADEERWAKTLDDLAELPRRQSEERDALERRHAFDREAAERAAGEAEADTVAARALLAEVRAALGTGGAT